MSRTSHRVVVTRPRERQQNLARALAAHGLSPVALPLIEVVPPADDAALRRAAGSREPRIWLFTSAAAVRPFVERWRAAGAPARPSRLVAVGRRTAEALLAEELGRAEVPDQQHGEGVLDYLLTTLPAHSHVLFPRAGDARPGLAEGLRLAGHRVDDPVAYEKRLPDDAPRAFSLLFASGEFGWVTFTSPRIVAHFVQLAGSSWCPGSDGLWAASIGPTTTAALRGVGVNQVIEAREPSDAQLAAAIARHLDS